MFTKVVVFCALMAFVNAAPIVDYATDPGVRPLHPIEVAPPNNRGKFLERRLPAFTGLNHIEAPLSYGGGKMTKRQLPAFEGHNHLGSVAGEKRRLLGLLDHLETIAHGKRELPAFDNLESTVGEKRRLLGLLDHLETIAHGKRDTDNLDDSGS